MCCFVSFLVLALIYFIGKEILVFWELYRDMSDYIDEKFEEDFKSGK